MLHLWLTLSLHMCLCFNVFFIFFFFTCLILLLIWMYNQFNTSFFNRFPFALLSSHDRIVLTFYRLCLHWHLFIRLAQLTTGLITCVTHFFFDHSKQISNTSTQTHSQLFSLVITLSFHVSFDLMHFFCFVLLPFISPSSRQNMFFWCLMVILTLLCQHIWKKTLI